MHSKHRIARMVALSLLPICNAACSSDDSTADAPDASTSARDGAASDSSTLPTGPGGPTALPDAGSPLPTCDPGAADVKLTIDATKDEHAISPYIYGTNIDDYVWNVKNVWTTYAKNLTLGRAGGNSWTTYNWENNDNNAGSDYNFTNYAYLGGGSTPGEAARMRVAAANAAGASEIVTIPIQGYVAADANGAVDPNSTNLSQRFRTVTQNKGSAPVYPPVTTDATVYGDEFVAWLESKFPNAHTDPQRALFYMLDNEPDIWANTHKEVQKSPITYAQLVQKNSEAAAMIKRVAPSALVFGLVSYGWNGYVNLQNAPDANGRDWIEFYLDQMKAAEGTNGKRIVDVLDLHYYTAATTPDGKTVQTDDAAAQTDAVAAARVQSTRSLWDDAYVEKSWITQYLKNKPVRLLPLMREKIAAHYPGTLLSISEYHFGGGNHISGGVAQADALGIFGREGVFAATHWPITPKVFDYTYAGFAMYRNYDGKNGSFGDTSISAQTSDIEKVTVYASLDSKDPGRMVIVALNKTAATVKASFSIAFGTALTKLSAYQLTNAAPSPAPVATPPVPNCQAFVYSLPAMSVTTFALH